MTQKMTFGEIARELGIKEEEVARAYKRAVYKILHHPLMPRLRKLYEDLRALRAQSEREGATRVLPKRRAG